VPKLLAFNMINVSNEPSKLGILNSCTEIDYLVTFKISNRHQCQKNFGGNKKKSSLKIINVEYVFLRRADFCMNASVSEEPR
jgi:hypothetical protein